MVSLCMLPEGLVSWSVNDQHAGDLQTFALKLNKHKHLNLRFMNKGLCVYCGCVFSYILNHLCLVYDCFFWDIGGTDLLSDSSGLPILNMSVS